MTLDGVSTGLNGFVTIAALGHTAKFLNELLPGVSSNVRGVLRLTSSQGSVVVAGLRTRYNQRGDFLITTTPVSDDAAAPVTSELVFPHIVDMGGYTTQFVLFSAGPGQTPAGTIRLFDQTGAAWNVAQSAADTVAPAVIATSTISSTSGVAVNKAVAAIFSEAMDPSTINSHTFMLQQGAKSVSGTVTIAGTMATFAPAGGFVPGMAYTAAITTGAKDLAGNALANNFTWTFMPVQPPADTTAPTVISVSPLNAATDLAPNATLSVTFSNAMDPSTMTSATFTVVTGSSSTPVQGTVGYDVVNKIVTFTPVSNLPAATTFIATITTGAKAVTGTAMAHNFVWSFTTQAPQISLVTSVNLPGSFVSAQNVYADSQRVYLSSYEGTIFVLQRNRAANFPLIQTISIGCPIASVRGDSNNLYAAGRDGNLYVYSKTWPLQLLRVVPLSSYGLSALEVVGENLYAAKGQASMAATASGLFLSEVNAGDYAVQVGSTNSYGQGGAAQGTTAAFNPQTTQQMGAIPNPSQDSVNVSASGSSIYLTTPDAAVLESTSTMPQR